MSSMAMPTAPAPTSPPTDHGRPPRSCREPRRHPVALADASVIITDTCRYSHEANDDPILDPGKSGQSMAHDFFGNTSTSATSTAATLVGGSTTCSTSD